jgi:hypothetical protein
MVFLVNKNKRILQVWKGILQKSYFHPLKNKKVIDSLCKSSMPWMWSNYAVSLLPMKVIKVEAPRRLFNAIVATMVIERHKPRQGHFLNESKLRIGKHSISNCITHLNNTNDPWLNPTLSNNCIRTTLKRH